VQRRDLTPVEASWFTAADLGAQRDAPAPLGCAECRNTGYKGRFIIAEIHLIDDELRDHITEGAPLSTLKTHATKQGVLSLLTQSAAHVVAGDTSIEEIRRVVGGV
jgi:general secretion pathway protein E